MAIRGVKGSLPQRRALVDAMSEKQLAVAVSAEAGRRGAMPIKNKGNYSAFNAFFENKENYDGAKRLQATLSKQGKCSFPVAKKIYAKVKSPGLRPSSMSPKQFEEFYVAFCNEQFPNSASPASSMLASFPTSGT
jgi:hypothetical protein